MELKYIAQREGRLSGFLRGELGMSAGLMNRLKWGDGIRVNGQSQHTDHPVKPGDVITVALDEPTPAYPPEEGPLAVLYEDDHLLAVDKPAGMLIHPSHCQNTGTLANRVLGYYQKTGQPCAFHPITRLDRDTYGVVLLAKNAHIHAAMNRLHSLGHLQKTYHALVFGCPAQTDGTVHAPIARRPLPSLLRYIGPEGKPSTTEFAVIRRYDDYAKLALRPVTGRTHQLRLHCAHIGCPILGDPQYGTGASQSFSQALGLSHQQLCAFSISFRHPITGAELCIRSSMDAEL